MEILQLGPLNLKVDWLIYLLAGMGTLLVLKKLLKEESLFLKQYSDTLFNAVFIWILLFKFSLVLFRPSILFENPLGVLYFNGGQKGMILASLFTFAYFTRSYYKLKWQWKKLGAAVIYTMVSFLLFCWVLRIGFALISF